MSVGGQYDKGPSADSFKSISVGGNDTASESAYFACGVRLDGRRICWGDNNHGQAPPGPSMEFFESVSAGVDFACGVKTDGRVACWGRNDFGQTEPPALLDRFQTVNAGFLYACALRVDGRAICWGAGPEL